MNHTSTGCTLALLVFVLYIATTATTAVQVSGKVLLHVWCPTQPTPYPATPPLIAISSSSIQPPLLLQLTHALATAAVGLVGDPMVHELAVRLVEQLEELPQQQQQQQQQQPPFDRPLAHAGNGAAAAAAAGVRKSEGEGESEGGESEDGYTEEAQQHAAAAEALLGGVRGGAPSDSSISSSSSIGAGGRPSSSVSSSSSSRAPPRRRGGRVLSPQQQEADSRRLLDYFKGLQVTDVLISGIPRSQRAT